MGASGWVYVVPYQDNLQAALDDLRRHVFATGAYVKPDDYGDVFEDLPVPGSVDDLEQEQFGEFMGTSGTHSVIDVRRIVPVDFPEEEFGAIRPLSDDEARLLFGMPRPSRADFDAVDENALDDLVTGGRWTGRAVVLWTEDKPSEIAFWGYSGD